MASSENLSNQGKSRINIKSFSEFGPWEYFLPPSHSSLGCRWERTTSYVNFGFLFGGLSDLANKISFFCPGEKSPVKVMAFLEHLHSQDSSNSSIFHWIFTNRSPLVVNSESIGHWTSVSTSFHSLYQICETYKTVLLIVLTHAFLNIFLWQSSNN